MSQLFLGESNPVLRSICQSYASTSSAGGGNTGLDHLFDLVFRHVTPTGYSSRQEYDKVMGKLFKEEEPFWTDVCNTYPLEVWARFETLFESRLKRQGFFKATELPNALIERITSSGKITSASDWVLNNWRLNTYVHAWYTVKSTDDAPSDRVFMGYVSSDLKLLHLLASNGMIKDANQVVNRVNDQLSVSNTSGFSTKFISCYKNGTHCVYRLQPLPMVNGIPQFECTVPPSGVPYAQLVSVVTELAYASSIFAPLATSEAVKVSIGSPVQNVIVTANPAVYMNAYSDIDKARAFERSKIPCGYTLYPHGIRVLNLESSLYSGKGYLNLQAFNIGKVEPCSASVADTSLRSLDPVAVTSFFVKKVSGLSQVNALYLQDRGFCPECNFATKEDIVRKAGDVHYSVLYRFMKANPDIFGTVDRGLKAIKSAETHTIMLPTDLENRRTTLQQLLSQQVVCLYVATKNGTRQLFATDNKDILAEKLGADYVGMYESFDNKLGYLKSYCWSKGINKVSDVTKLITKWNIPYIDANDLESFTSEGFDKMFELGKARKPVRKFTPKPENITLRCVNITDAKDYFKTINLGNIERVEI